MPDRYRGLACVHWSMTIRDRQTGWLTESFHLQCRELLLHTSYRYSLAVPCYTLMPDHLHLLWLGYSMQSDQRNASKFFRKYINEVLERAGCVLQGQGYDHLLRKEEREKNAFAKVAFYILENPVRGGLVNDWKEYPFSGTVLVGFPDLDVREEGFWDKFWRIYYAIVEEAEAPPRS